MRFFILILSLSFLWPLREVSASGVIEARQRALQQQQIQAVRAQQQQAIQAQQRAYQQAALQRQSQIQQQAVGQAIANRNAQQQAYNAAVQQKLQNVIEQNQMAAMSAQQQVLARIKAEQQAYNQVMAQQGVMMSQGAASLPQPPMTMPGVQQPAYGNLFYTPPVEEVVNITDVWKKMEENSRVWNTMIDMEPKILTVSRMVDHFKNQGITIRKAPSHYVQLIDSMAFQNPQMLEQPFENIMKVVSIIEYDFDNGQNKDALARQIFPDDQQFNANKKRLGF